MTDKRTTILITGEVQKVGYRDFVQRVARKLGVVGYVENMRGGSVKVVYETDESTIEEFKKAINVKAKFIDVQDIAIVETIEPTGEFEYFDIKRGDMADELGERLDVSILYLDTMKEELKTEISGVRTDIQAMNSDMNDRFDTLDDKYGAISQQMNTLTVELQTSTKSLVSLTEKIGALIDQKLAE